MNWLQTKRVRCTMPPEQQWLREQRPVLANFQVDNAFSHLLIFYLGVLIFLGDFEATEKATGAAISTGTKPDTTVARSRGYSDTSQERGDNSSPLRRETQRTSVASTPTSTPRSSGTARSISSTPFKKRMGVQEQKEDDSGMSEEWVFRSMIKKRQSLISETPASSDWAQRALTKSSSVSRPRKSQAPRFV